MSTKTLTQTASRAARARYPSRDGMKHEREACRRLDERIGKDSAYLIVALCSAFLAPYIVVTFIVWLFS